MTEKVDFNKVRIVVEGSLKDLFDKMGLTGDVVANVRDITYDPRSGDFFFPIRVSGIKGKSPYNRVKSSSALPNAKLPTSQHHQHRRSK